MALDVAQNKHAGKQFTEVGCHEQIVSWLEVVFRKGEKGLQSSMFAVTRGIGHRDP